MRTMPFPPRRWTPQAARGAAIALGTLIGLGVGLRVAFVVAYRPGFLGYPDSGIFYIPAARDSLFGDPWHLAGYAAFLRTLHWLEDALLFTIVVQHALGVAAAILLYLAVRRVGKPVWIALVPAAAVLLGGDHVFLEHGVVAESLFTALLAGALYAAARSMDGDGVRWPAAAGALAALSGTTRISAFAFVPLVAAWLLLVPVERSRWRALRGAVAACAGTIVILGYLVAGDIATGQWSLGAKNPYNFYARTATFADCAKFTPPRGTAWLCDRTPHAEDREPRWYLISGGPLVRRYGSADVAPPSAATDVRRFAFAAALGQPVDWLRTAATDFGKYVDPPANSVRTPDAYVQVLVSPYWTPIAQRYAGGYYDGIRIAERPRVLRTLRDYAELTRFDGVPMVALLVLALLAPIACRDRLRLGAILLVAVAYAILVIPVLTLDYDARYGVPAYGPLAAGAAMGAYGIATRLRRLRDRH